MRAAFAWLRRARRLRIVCWALLFGVLCGVTEFGQPAEDGLRAIRNEITQRPADKSITVVAIDDRTMNSIKGSNPSRFDDARIIDKLFKMGASRLFFDRAFADQTSVSEDVALREAFKRHHDKIFIGATPGGVRNQNTGFSPLPMFRDVVQVRSLWGESAPFALSARFPYQSHSRSGLIKSLSVELANAKIRLEGFYRPDFSINPATIPTISYIALDRGRVDTSLIAHKDILFGYTSIAAHDLHVIPFKGDVPGVYFHVIGAQTLKEGVAYDIGWLPAYFLAALSLLVLISSRRSSAVKIIVLEACALLAAPFILPLVFISADIIPAFLALSIAGTRLALYARRSTNSASGLPTIEQLRSRPISSNHQVFAVKIRNYASIKASSDRSIERSLVIELCRRIQLCDGAATIAHDRDTLVWTRLIISPAELQNHAHGLHALLATGVDIAGNVADVAVSIGVDINYAAMAGARVDGAMQCAEDAALTASVCKVGAEKTVTDWVWEVQILSQLEQAIDNGQLWVAYQPKISMLTNAQTGAEALVRWTHPERGPIEPNAFIPIAEQHNRMERLTAFVLDQAMATLSAASALNPDFKMAVNLSTQMLRSDRIIETIEMAVAKHRVRAEQLVIEITETAPIETNAGALDILNRMKAIGIRLSIDDFGTGNATIEYLVKIPADEVKIDRMFVTDLETNSMNQHLARSVILMAHSLGLAVVAEGVETADVHQSLKQMGCDEGQGYFYDKPLTARDLLDRLADRRAAA